jgi:hypothetical protein
MLENRLCGTVLLKIKKKLLRLQNSAKTKNPWHVNREQHFTRGWNRQVALWSCSDE